MVQTISRMSKGLEALYVFSGGKAYLIVEKGS